MSPIFSQCWAIKLFFICSLCRFQARYTIYKHISLACIHSHAHFNMIRCTVPQWTIMHRPLILLFFSFFFFVRLFVQFQSSTICHAHLILWHSNAWHYMRACVCAWFSCCCDPVALMLLMAIVQVTSHHNHWKTLSVVYMCLHRLS